MSKKRKYKEDLYAEPHFSEELYRNTRDHDREGEAIFIVYMAREFHVIKHYWGTDMDYEYSRSGLVEAITCCDEANTNLLMARLGVRGGKKLLQEIKRRFVQAGSTADCTIQKFCEAHDIHYHFSVYY